MSAYQIFSNYMANCSTFPSNHCPMSYPSTDAYKCKFKCVLYMLYLLEMLKKKQIMNWLYFEIFPYIFLQNNLKKSIEFIFWHFFCFLKENTFFWFSDPGCYELTQMQKTTKDQNTSPSKTTNQPNMYVLT